MNFPKKMVLVSVLILAIAPLFFVNCAGPASENQTSQSSSLRYDNDINTFTRNPPPLEGFSGFQFLLDEYLGPHCGSCHDNKVSFGGQFFDVTNRQKSYDQSSYALKKTDMIMRITNNPFCPSCSLNPNGEVYRAIMYWLDHR